MSQARYAFSHAPLEINLPLPFCCVAERVWLRARDGRRIFHRINVVFPQRERKRELPGSYSESNDAAERGSVRKELPLP